MADSSKKLYRSNNDRWFAGVCGGIAEYFDLDPTLIRVLFILFGFAIGGGLIIYLIMWLVIPQAPEDAMGHSPEEEIADPPESAEDEE